MNHDSRLPEPVSARREARAPRFSIVVPCYRIASRRELVEQCAASIALQTFVDYELIFVDDGSPDGSSEILREIIAATPGLASRAVIHALPENGGVCAARNAGIDASSGDYIAFLDFDDLWQENYLAAVSSALDEDPARQLILVRTDFLSTVGNRIRVRSGGSVAFLNRMDAPDLDAWHLLHNFPVGMGSAIVIERKLLQGQDAIRFDLHLSRTTAEDVLFGFQLLDRGIRPWYVDEALCVHRKFADMVSRGRAAYLAVDEKSVNDYIAEKAVDALQARILSERPGHAEAIARRRRRLDLQFDLKRQYRSMRAGFGVFRCLGQPRGLKTLARLHLENFVRAVRLDGIWQAVCFRFGAEDQDAAQRVARLVQTLSRRRGDSVPGLRAGS